MNLTALLKQNEFSSRAQKAILNILVSESWLAGKTSALLAPKGITRNQYNVLCILRGSHPKPYRCSEIAERLIDKTPDVTRLLARIEKNGLVSRQRAQHDRRIVEVQITPKGLALLEELDKPMEDLQNTLTKNLSAEELDALSDLLDKLRVDQVL